MAVDLFTDRSSSMSFSPRISFSHDLNNSDIIPIEQQQHIPLKTSLLDYDFDFCVSKRNCDQNSSLADDLFANGVILPIQINRKTLPTLSKPPLPPSSAHSIFEAENARETEEKHRKDDDSNSFWKFKRSKSFSCGRIYRRGLCSLPLLSRSKSTGSTITSAKKSLIPKDEQYYIHQHQQKKSSVKNSSTTHHQKPPLKKYYSGSSSFNSGLIQVNPVINVTTGSLFGFYSFFSNGKDKGKKK